MAARKRKPKSNETQLAIVKIQTNSLLISKIIDMFAKLVGYLIFFYYGWRSVDSLAGKVTIAHIKGLWGADGAPWTVVLGLIFCIICLVMALIFYLYGKWRERLMRDTIEHLHDRVKFLETAFDSGRSSSGITKRGETP